MWYPAQNALDNDKNIFQKYVLKNNCDAICTFETVMDFTYIYKIYEPKIHRYISSMVGADEAEDLTQDVFIKVSKKLDSLKDTKNISTWIYKIATNTAIDRIRSLSYRKMSKLIPEDELISEDQNALNYNKVLSIDQQLIEEEMNQCIENYIYSLPENYRTVLVLSELELLKDKEIAEVLDLTLETIKIRLHRARAKLKKTLESGCDFYCTENGNLACEPK